MTMKLIERMALEVSTAPIDTTGAAIVGDFYNLEKYRNILWLIQQGAWAGGTPAVTLRQATTAAGGSAKALSFTKHWTKLIAGTVWTEVAVTSDTFNLGSVAATVVAVEINAEDLDTNNDFQYVSLDVASPGANADLISIATMLGDPRYSGDPEDQLPDPKV